MIPRSLIQTRIFFTYSMAPKNHKRTRSIVSSSLPRDSNNNNSNVACHLFIFEFAVRDLVLTSRTIDDQGWINNDTHVVLATFTYVREHQRRSVGTPAHPSHESFAQSDYRRLCTKILRVIPKSWLSVGLYCRNPGEERFRGLFLFGCKRASRLPSSLYCKIPDFH